MCKFGRDVLVNVLANLIAAPLIYLFGVLGGLFPQNTGAVLTALMVLAASLTVVLMVVSFAIRSEKSSRAAALKIVVLAGALGMSGVWGILAAFVNDSTMSTFQKVLLGIMGAAALFTSGMIFRLVRIAKAVAWPVDSAEM